MRKIVWCCAALALVAVVAACLIADYAGRHPGSLVGRCVVSGYRLAVASVPALKAGSAAVESLAMAEKTLLAVPTTTGLVPGKPAEPEGTTAPDSDYCPPADPVPAPEEPAAEEPAVTGTGVNSDAGIVGKIVVQPDAEEPAPAPGPAAAGAEESEPPSVMPHAEDAEPVPEKMPYAEDEESEQVEASPIDFWWGLLQEAATHCTDAGGEECEHGSATKHCPCCEPGAGPHGQKPAAEDATEEEDRGTQEVAPPPGADTSEFRPSDANPGDFDSIPY